MTVSENSLEAGGTLHLIKMADGYDVVMEFANGESEILFKIVASPGGIYSTNKITWPLQAAASYHGLTFELEENNDFSGEETGSSPTASE